MPVYLLHGFRWPRNEIRRHILFRDIEDAAPEYITGPQTSKALLASLNSLYPNIMHALPSLRFVEQYNPNDVGNTALSQPFAFVADKVEQLNLSLDVVEAMNKGVKNEGWDALMDLKEQLAPDEKLGWWIVFNGDETRLQNGVNEEQHQQFKKQRSRLKRLLHK